MSGTTASFLQGIDHRTTHRNGRARAAPARTHRTASALLPSHLLHPLFTREGVMNFLQDTDWHRLFWPQMSLPEVLIRGTLVYVSLCILLRVILKRQAGKIGLADLLVVSVVAGVCRNPLVRDAYSVPDGLAVVAVVLGWGYALDWLSYHSPLAHKLFHPRQVVLIRDGRVEEGNLRHELMTDSQLLCQLRQQGVTGPEQVAEAVLEGSGAVSVIRKESITPRPALLTRPCDSPATNGARAETPGAPLTARVAGEEPSAVDEFLRAITRLEEEVASLKELLAAHGVRWNGARAEPRRGRPSTTPPDPPAAG
jgi:uncharacterized membrane protein YcaP (DUF421 family)